MKKNITIWYIFFTLTYILWGTQPPTLKALSGQVSPYLLNFLRFSLATVALFPFFLKNRKQVSRKDLLSIALLGVVGSVLFGIINIFGVRLSTSVNQSIILNSWPLMAAVLLPFLIKEKVSKGTIYGLIIGFIGLVIVVTEGKIGAITSSQYFIGNLLILLSGLCLVVNTAYNRKYIEKYGGLNVSFWAVLTATIILFFISLISGDFSGITKINVSTWLLLIWLGVMTTAIMWVVWYNGIKKIGLVKANSFFLIVPPAGILFSIIFLGETVSLLKIFGAALLLIGLGVVQTRKQ